jgi:pimeloyl-[acyl-carrier protein] synthase
LMLLFADGVENVDSMIANAVAALLQNPGQLALLQAQPQLMSQAVDECLRFESPAQFVGRVALEDIELQGVSVAQGSGVLLVIGAANRDPRQFGNADGLDITRSPNPHLSFGKGKHACIGGPLVRQEVEQALAVLLDSLTDLELVQPELQWQQRLGHRWLQALPLTFTAASS